MKRSILTFGIAIIALLSAGDLEAQRSRSQDGDRADRGRREVRSERGRDDRNRDGYRNNNNRNNNRTANRGNNRATNRGNNRSYRDRNGRNVRVVSNRTIRYDGYRNSGYPVRSRFSVVYDYDYRNGRRFRLERRARPSGRHIWVSGHWRFSNRLQRDVWVGGTWAVQARHHRWVDGHYERFQGRRTWVDACWVRNY